MSALPETRTGPIEMIKIGSFSSGRGPRLVAAVAGQASYQVAQALIPVLIGTSSTGQSESPTAQHFSCGLRCCVLCLSDLLCRGASRFA